MLFCASLAANSATWSGWHAWHRLAGTSPLACVMTSWSSPWQLTQVTPFFDMAPSLNCVTMPGVTNV
jgi:hypothetical protein